MSVHPLAEEYQWADIVRTNLNTIDENQIGADKRDELLTIADNTFNQPLSEYDYISFDDLWSDNFDAELQPLKSIVCDIFADAKEGDKVPLGVFYKGSTAFTITEYADGSKALTQYDIDPTAQQVQAINANDEAFHNDYIVVSRQEAK